MRTGNLFVDALPPQEGERTETLLTQKNLVIERTISSADIAPHEYVQSQDEWVVLLRGNAILNVAGEIVELNAGDYLFYLPACPIAFSMFLKAPCGWRLTYIKNNQIKKHLGIWSLNR